MVARLIVLEVLHRVQQDAGHLLLVPELMYGNPLPVQASLYDADDWMDDGDERNEEMQSDCYAVEMMALSPCVR